MQTQNEGTHMAYKLRSDYTHSNKGIVWIVGSLTWKIIELNTKYRTLECLTRVWQLNMFAQLQAQHGTGKSIVYALHQRINESVYPASTHADHGVVISRDFHEHGRNRCLCVWLVYSS